MLKKHEVGLGLQDSTWSPCSFIMYTEPRFFTVLSPSNKPPGIICSESLEMSVDIASYCSSYHFLFSWAFESVIRVTGRAVVLLSLSNQAPFLPFPAPFAAFRFLSRFFFKVDFVREIFGSLNVPFQTKGDFGGSGTIPHHVLES